MRFPGYPPLIVLSDAENIKKIYSGNADTFQSGIANRLLKTSMGQHSVIVLDGEEHMRLRKVLQAPLHGERMKFYKTAMQSACDEVCSQWQDGESFSLYNKMQAVTLKVIIQNIFGVNSGKNFRLIEKRATDVMQMFANPWGLLLAKFDGSIRFENLVKLLGPLSPMRWMQKKLKNLDDILFEEIEKKRSKNSKSDDILSLLLSSKDESGNILSDQEIRDQLVTMLLAGHETTATSVCWVLYHLFNNESVFAKLLGQLREHNWDEETPYLDAVIRESLRLSPVVPLVVRYLNQSVALGDMNLPKGVIVAPCIYLVHHEEELYADACRFKPERMLDTKLPAYQYFPFGGGIRHCIGWAFSTYELKVVITYILQHYTLRLKPGYKMRLTRRGITLVPSNGLPIVVQKKI